MSGPKITRPGGGGGVSSASSTPESEAPYMTHYYSDLAQGKANLGVVGDSMSVDFNTPTLGNFFSWPYLMRLDMRNLLGSASASLTPDGTPVAAKAQIHNMSIAGYDFDEQIADGRWQARIASAHPSLLVVPLGLNCLSVDDYLARLEAFILTLRANTNVFENGKYKMSVLHVHQYTPNHIGWSAWISGKTRAKKICHKYGIAFVSIEEQMGTGLPTYGSGPYVNLYDMTAHGKVTDNIHTNQIGQQKIWDCLRPFLLPIWTQRLLSPTRWDRRYNLWNNSVAEGSIFNTPYSVPAFMLEPGDCITQKTTLLIINFSGTGGRTARMRQKFAGTTIFDRTYNIGALGNIFIDLTYDIYVREVGAVSKLNWSAKSEHSDNTGLDTIGEMQVGNSAINITASTLVALTADITAQLSAAEAGFGTEVIGSYLELKRGQAA